MQNFPLLMGNTNAPLDNRSADIRLPLPDIWSMASTWDSDIYGKIVG